MEFPPIVSGRDLLSIFESFNTGEGGEDRVERVVKEVGGNWELKRIPIDKINFHMGSVEAPSSKKLIKRYAQMKSDIPPVILDYFESSDGKDYEIIDGFHRVAVAQQRGDRNVLAYIPEGCAPSEVVEAGRNGYKIELDKLDENYFVVVTHPDASELIQGMAPNVVGYAEFSVDGKNLVPEHTEVAHAHRRKGLATKMYQFIEKKTGKKIRPSRIQTEDSEKLWGQPNRPFGSVTSATPNSAWKDQIPGGKADKKLPSDFDPEQLAKGVKVELEHTSSPHLAKEIAMDHLAEDPDYYTKLATIHTESNVEAGKEGDWEQEGYTITHQTEGKILLITAKDPSGNTVGSVGFRTLPQTDEIQADSSSDKYEPFIDKVHRRKGLASAMYRHAEKISGRKITPTDWQSLEGEKLWAQPKRPFGSVTSAIPNLALETYAWSPAKVHEKLSQVVPIANQQMPPGMFLQHTLEKDDDVPIIRLLSGNGDPYTAERLGSFAFFSTQRGMEWFIKLFGPVPFIPQSGMVYLTYFDDRSHDEEPAGLLSMQDEDSVWASRLLTILGAPNASPALEAPPSEEGAPSILNTKPMPIETSPWFEQKGGQSQSYRNAPIVYPDLELPDALWPIGWQPGQKGQHPSISNCLESSLAVALRPVYDRMEGVWKTKKSSKVTSESLRRSKWISLAAVQSPRSTLTLSVALSTVLSLAQTSEKNQNLKSLIQSNVELPEPLKKQFIAWVDSLPQSFHTKGNSKVAIISEIKNTNVEYDTAEQWYVRYAMFTVEVKTGDETPFRMLFRGYWSSQKPGITLLEFKRFFNHQKESYESEKTFSRIESKTYPESIMPTELNDFSLDDMKRLAITRYEGKALRADSFQDFQELLDKIMVEQELEEIYRKTVAGLLNRARKAKGYDPL